MKQVDFYYVRHGQTVFNVERRLQGQCDSPLTEKGILDAGRAEKALRMIPFDRAYCSSSERCVDTAAIILARHNTAAMPLKGLKEVCFGSLDGRLMSEMEEEFARRKRTTDYADIGGDSAESIRKRIADTMGRIASEALHREKVLIVSHGNYGMIMLETLFGMDTDEFTRQRRKIDPTQYAFPNCGIMKFRFTDGNWELLSIPTDPEQFVDRSDPADYPKR